MSGTSPHTFLTPGSPEAHLLLACARTTLDPEVVEKIRGLLKHQLNWDYVLQKAEEHFVMPLVCRSLDSFAEAVPKEILQRLHNDFFAHARRNLFYTGELLKLLASMEEHGIKAVPYKGPVLSASAYGSVVLRTFIDLDILVHERDILRTKELLLSRGFHTVKTQLTRAQEEARLRSRDQKDIVFVHPGLPIRVELHWRVASLFLFPLDSDPLWQRLGTITLGGARVSNLSAEDMLLVLCVHGAKHSFKRLQWICDIAELIRANPHMDWNQVLKRARNLRSVRMLSLGLSLASNLLGATMPREVTLTIESDPEVKSVAARVLALLFPSNGGISLALTGSYFHVNLKEEWTDRTRLRLRYYLHKLTHALRPNVRDTHLLPLPELLSFLYYLVRPIRVAKIYGLGRLMQLVGHGKRQGEPREHHKPQ
ncbi:MAG: nucleotidyltransferase domain-containing protein [Pyrinomonadaceae bacterium]